MHWINNPSVGLSNQTRPPGWLWYYQSKPIAKIPVCRVELILWRFLNTMPFEILICTSAFCLWCHFFLSFQESSQACMPLTLGMLLSLGWKQRLPKDKVSPGFCFWSVGTCWPLAPRVEGPARCSHRVSGRGSRASGRKVWVLHPRGPDTAARKFNLGKELGLKFTQRCGHCFTWSETMSISDSSSSQTPHNTWIPSISGPQVRGGKWAVL